MVDTDEALRINAAFDSMKLIAQIAGGILFAGVLSWLFWFSILTAAVPAIPKVTADISHALHSEGPLPTSASAPAPLERVIPTAADCKNFVQMTGGTRHCLNDHITTPPLQRQPLRSTAR
jgi:hypothetical protein